ncbi:MAG: tRNA guanosine(34) transglycosylase Tgt [Rickettsiales bacterium]
MSHFSILSTDNLARTGILQTAHGDIRTPAFMPVGTAATVKGMTPEMVNATGADILLGNTYHLMLRPGAERIASQGGLHRFMQWNKPILTDSGGFQVMSLGEMRKISEDGVMFKSHIDGSEHHLTPERAMEIQYLLGSDISMVFDECTSYPCTEEDAAKSMRLSMRWAQRSKMAFQKREGYHAFGIQQGSMFRHLREESSKALVDIGFDGYAIGGLAVGEGQDVMFSVLDYAVDMLPSETPRYLMGVGKPSDIIGAVLRGVDMFDCVIPTRSGRFGRAYTPEGEINIKNAAHADDKRPLWNHPDCPVSKYSRAYLHHLFKADEMLGPILLTWHNLYFYQWLMQEIRTAIQEKRIAEFARSWKAS